MKNKFNQEAETTLDILAKGAFLTASHGGKTNTMTIAWGSLGVMWGKPVFTALVRKSRFTHELIEKAGTFTVSLPAEDMQKALALCGAKSGRSIDKIAAAGLKIKNFATSGAPHIDCKGVHYECKVLFRNEMNPADLSPEIREKWYADNDYHTYYYGEILNTEIL